VRRRAGIKGRNLRQADLATQPPHDDTVCSKRKRNHQSKMIIN
jgi:hypothetical protein